MSTNFPSGLDTFPSQAALNAKKLSGATDPAPEPLGDHSASHANLGDAIEAIEGVLNPTITRTGGSGQTDNLLALKAYGGGDVFTVSPAGVAHLNYTGSADAQLLVGDNTDAQYSLATLDTSTTGAGPGSNVYAVDFLLQTVPATATGVSADLFLRSDDDTGDDEIDFTLQAGSSAVQFVATDNPGAGGQDARLVFQAAPNATSQWLTQTDVNVNRSSFQVSVYDTNLKLEATKAAGNSGTNFIDIYDTNASGHAKLLAVTGSGAVDLLEQSTPSAPAANTARFFARDNGAGKTELCVIFNTGAVQVLATQP